jgi:hypothetical protein
MSSGARRRQAVGAVLTVVAAGVALSACGSPPGVIAGLPPTPPTVDIVMKEFAIQRPATIPEGRVVFRVHNAGHLQHVLQILIWPPNLPPFAEQLQGGHPAIRVNELAGTPLQMPGQTDEFAIDLPPGQYAMVDMLLRPDGKFDAQLGMATEFRVGGSVTGSASTTTQPTVAR